MKRFIFSSLSLLTTGLLVAEQSDYYVIEEIPLPEGEVIEVGSIALLPDQKVAVSSRRGDVWVCEGAYGDDLSQVKWSLFYSGLHEPFGMYWKDGSLFATDRAMLTRLTDTDGDGSADLVENVNSGWGINGDYHEYAFGSTPDKDGNTWIALCLTGSAGAKSDWRGWGMRITPEGEMIPTVSGIRSPGGIGFNAAGDAFYTDNQGLWNGSSSLKWMKPGGFMGNPVGNKYHKLAGLPEPPNPESGSRIETERQKFPDTLIPPAIVLPHAKLGQSPTAVITDHSEGSFGPFAGQVLVGEQCHSQVQRVDLEMVNGVYQGAAFPFLEGYPSGIVPMRLADDGTLFSGGTNRGWGARGPKPFSFERTRWTGKIPFEVLEMNATPGGFELTFTEPVDKATVTPQSFSMEAWTYIYQQSYGSPEVDQATPVIQSATVSEDGLRVTLTVSGRVKGHVHHLKCDGLKNQAGKPLWHTDAYYTLNEIPE